jgi:glycosyltransferase involved in cell wall biosynthesis
MRIAVITPYYKEKTEVLLQCHQSVLTQSISADHFFVSDGFPNTELIKWNVKHVSLPEAHGDFGDTPRGIGSLLANVEGYDFITYLDADNWMHTDHLSSLFSLWENTKADVCTSFRTFHTITGIEMPISERDEQLLNHVDTSCYFLHRNTFEACDIWLKMPKVLHAIGDRVFYSGLKSKKYRFAHTKQKTIAYRSQYKGHYLSANMEPPQDCKEIVGKESREWLLTLAGIRETVAKLGFIP